MTSTGFDSKEIVSVEAPQAKRAGASKPHPAFGERGPVPTLVALPRTVSSVQFIIEKLL